MYIELMPCKPAVMAVLNSNFLLQHADASLLKSENNSMYFESTLQVLHVLVNGKPPENANMNLLDPF